MSNTRVVVCAANKYGTYVFTGIRHFCPIMVFNMKDHDIVWYQREFEEVQGFVDQYGVFMDRKEALAVAIAAGQVNRYSLKGNPQNILFSEDLY